jgi:hypothetical protein
MQESSEQRCHYFIHSVGQQMLRNGSATSAAVWLLQQKEPKREQKKSQNRSVIAVHLNSSLRLPPFVAPTNVCVPNTLNQDCGIWCHLTRTLDCISLRLLHAARSI